MSIISSFGGGSVNAECADTHLTPACKANLRTDMIEVCKILRGLKGTDEVKFFQRRVSKISREGMT